MKNKAEVYKKKVKKIENLTENGLRLRAILAYGFSSVIVSLVLVLLGNSEAVLLPIIYFVIITGMICFTDIFSDKERIKKSLQKKIEKYESNGSMA